MGVSDMIDLVMDLYPCKTLQIWLDVHNKYIYSCCTLQRILAGPTLQVPSTSEPSLLVSQLDTDAKTMP